MRHTYQDYMNNDDTNEACPDCKSTEGQWLPATATEQEEWWCAGCNEVGTDELYDNWKDRKAEQS